MKKSEIWRRFRTTIDFLFQFHFFLVFIFSEAAFLSLLLGLEYKISFPEIHSFFLMKVPDQIIKEMISFLKINANKFHLLFYKQ